MPTVQEPPYNLGWFASRLHGPVRKQDLADDVSLWAWIQVPLTLRLSLSKKFIHALSVESFVS